MVSLFLDFVKLCRGVVELDPKLCRLVESGFRMGSDLDKLKTDPELFWPGLIRIRKIF
jgi:hypothetical protein